MIDSHTRAGNDTKPKYDEIPKDAGKNAHPELEARQQRYVLTIEKENQYITPLPLDVMFITTDQLKECVSWYLPKYSLRKRSRIELFIRKWYFKYMHLRWKKRFAKKMKRFHQKYNPHLFN